MTLSRNLPIEFICRRHQLNWNEIDLGLTEGWIDSEDLTESLHLLDLRSIVDGELLFLSKEKLFDIVRGKAQLQPADPQETRMAWLRLLLAWIFENREKIEDPLLLAEQVYADFDYPIEIYDFIRFNPPRHGWRPQDHTQEENTKRLMGLWEDYCHMHANQD